MKDRFLQRSRSTACAFALALGACQGLSPSASTQATNAMASTTNRAPRASAGELRDWQAQHLVRPQPWRARQWAEHFDQALKAAPDLSFSDLKRELSWSDSRSASLTFTPNAARFYSDVLAKMKLSADEIAHLDREGVVIVDHHQRYSMGSAYYAIYTSDLPVLITSDSILHAWHRSFDTLLSQLESEVFLPQLVVILERTLSELQKTELEQNLAVNSHDLQVYLATALALLDPQQAIKKTLKPAVRAEVKALVGAVGRENFQKFEIYGGVRSIDFSQFKPRGHYNESSELQRYFRAMMWLGRADTGFVINKVDSESGLVIAVEREQMNAALLSLVLLTSGVSPDLQALDEVIGFLVGQSDNLGPQGVQAHLKRLSIGDARVLAQLNKQKELGESLAADVESQQAIRSQALFSRPENPKQTALPQLFQLFGQRFIADSFVLSKVVYDAVFFQGRKQQRMIPSGLDVAAALGNNRAVEHLELEIKKHQYGSYLLAARKTFDALAEDQGKTTIYNRWLAALRELSQPLPPSGKLAFPQMMRSAAWTDKMLQTQLGSWTELRRDTVLYGKQSYTATPACEYPTGYVEPYPAFYRAMRDMATQTALGLQAVSKTGPASAIVAGQRAFLQEFAQTMNMLGELADQELAQEPFTAAQASFIKKTLDQRGGGSGPPTYDGWYPKLIYRGDPAQWKPAVVDVHTYPDPTGKLHILHAATGDVNFVVAAIDNGSDHAVYVGPVFSYYEFVDDHRLDETAWEARLEQGPSPKAPHWLESVKLPGTARAL